MCTGSVLNSLQDVRAKVFSYSWNAMLLVEDVRGGMFCAISSLLERKKFDGISSHSITDIEFFVQSK